MQYYTRYQRYESKSEKQESVSKTGVIHEPTTKERIEKFLSGNQDQMMSKPGDFDFPPGSEIPDNYWDHTRQRGYDMFDAHKDVQRARDIVSEYEKQAQALTDKQKAEKQSAQKVVDAVDTGMSAKPNTADIGKPSTDSVGGLNG